jgi:hypothetical protein
MSIEDYFSNACTTIMFMFTPNEHEHAWLIEIHDNTEQEGRYHGYMEYKIERDAYDKGEICHIILGTMHVFNAKFSSGNMRMRYLPTNFIQECDIDQNTMYEVVEGGKYLHKYSGTTNMPENTEYYHDIYRKRSLLIKKTTIDVSRVDFEMFASTFTIGVYVENIEVIMGYDFVLDNMVKPLENV